MGVAETIALRLADEGVPLRAIARATAIPSPELYETLVKARMDGTLLTLPRDDWPPGCPRDQRALQLSRLAADNHDALILAIKDVFHMTPSGARVFLMLVLHERVPHARVDMEHAILVVNIYRMRRDLAAFGIEIRTLWGYGYQLSPVHRRQAMDLILREAAPAADPAAGSRAG